MSEADNGAEPPVGRTKETIQTLADFNAEHYRNLSASSRAIDRAVHIFAEPAFIASAAGLIVFWIGYNLTAHALGCGRSTPIPSRCSSSSAQSPP